jgi:hypothetical protein
MNELSVADEQAALELTLKRFPARHDLWRTLCQILLRRGTAVNAALLARAFPEYPGIGVMHGFIAPCCAEVAPTLKGEHLEPVLAWLHGRFPDCPVALYFYADWLFQTERIAQAHAILNPHRELALQHDFLARLYAIVLWRVNRRAECRAFYEEFFEGYSGDQWRDVNFAERQREAVGRGIPPVFIATLPKSGSLFILNTLRDGLRAPHCGMSYIGLFADLIPRRVRDFAIGGAVAVEHMFPTERDVGLLRDAGVRRLVFHTRDIRQVALSFVHHGLSDEVDTVPRVLQNKRRNEVYGDQAVFERTYRTHLAQWLRFLEDWLAFLETDHGFEIHLTTFDDLTGDEEGFFRGVLGFFGIRESQFDWSVLARSKAERAGHFRKGKRDEWREVLSPEAQARTAELIARYPRVARSLA